MKKIALVLLSMLATTEVSHANLTSGKIDTPSCVSVYLPVFRNPFRDCTHRSWYFKERWPTVKIGTQLLPFPEAPKRVAEQALIPVISASAGPTNTSAKQAGAALLIAVLYLVLITLMAAKP